MGVQRGGHEATVDVHGMHVREMLHVLDEWVLPVLPVLKAIVVIVGQGPSRRAWHACRACRHACQLYHSLV